MAVLHIFLDIFSFKDGLLCIYDTFFYHKAMLKQAYGKDMFQYQKIERTFKLEMSIIGFPLVEI